MSIELETVEMMNVSDNALEIAAGFNQKAAFTGHLVSKDMANMSPCL